MPLVVAGGEKVGHRQLLQRSGRDGLRELQQRHALAELARGDPPDAPARRQRLGEAAAVENEPALIERLRGPGARASEIDVAVQIVLDERYAATGEQGHQPLLVLVGHHAAERIGEVGHRQHGGDPARLQHPRESIEVHSLARTAGYLHRSQAQRLDQLQ